MNTNETFDAIHEGETQQAEFVEVMYARTIDDARRYCSDLIDAEIPARIESPAPKSSRRGVAVLVPSDALVAASQFLTDPSRDIDEDEVDDDFEDDTDEYDDDDDLDDDLDDDDLDDDDDEAELEEEDDF